MTRTTPIAALLLATSLAFAQQPTSFGLPGVAQPSQQVTLSVPVEGVLREMLVTEGATVKAGQILARLDDTVAKAAVEAARVATDRTAELQHADHEMRLAQLKVDKLASIVDSGAVRTLDLEEAKTRLAQAKASVLSARQAARQAQCNLALEQARLDRLTIRAPFDGIVTRLHASPGATLTAATPLLHLVNLQTLRAEIFVPVAQFAQLQAKAAYDIRIGAPASRKAQATLTFVDPVLDSATGTVRCLIELDNRKLAMPAGIPVHLIGKSAPPAKPSPSGR